MTDKQNEVELLACPFCGGNALLEDFSDGRFWHVSCVDGDCDIQPETDTHGSESEARAAWNRRAETADWTSEVPTEEGFYWVLRKYDTMMIVYVCNIVGRMEVHGSSNPHQLLMEAYIDSYDIVAWSKIPTPPLPGKEGM